MNGADSTSPRRPDGEALPRGQAEGVRGVLICLVVLGHNTLLSGYYPTVFNVLYNFHVAAFLVLPWLALSKSAEEGFLGDRAVRYLVPHYLFFLLACAAFFLLILQPEGPVPTLQWLGKVGVAAIVGTQERFKEACGMRFLWFMPALLAVNFTVFLWVKAGRKAKAVLLAVALAVHLFFGLVPYPSQSWVPFGIQTALFLLPSGLLIAYLRKRYGRFGGRAVLPLAGLFALFLAAAVSAGSYTAIGAAVLYPTVFQPGRFLLHDVIFLLAVLTLLAAAPFLEKSKVLRSLGRHSLLIFLSHVFIWRLLLRTGAADALTALMPGRPAAVVLSVTATIVLSWMVSRLVWSSPYLKPLVIPRDREEWMEGLRRARAVPGSHRQSVSAAGKSGK